MKFYVTERIGPKRSFTPEGFLLCQDVPIARIGVLDYLESELPGVEGASGVIRVERHEEDVFAPEAIASFAGKPLVNDHPNEDVTPANWRELAVGTVLNPRRGEGNFADVMMADLLVTDEDAIEAIQDGKVEVSCGYDANYKQIKPGLARQHGIIGNHLAIVTDGRCGPRCSIGDQAISITMKEGQMAATVAPKKSFKDRLMAAVRSKDEKAIEKIAGEVTEDEETIAESDVKGTSAAGITINVHGTGAPAAAAKETTDEEVDPNAGKEDTNKPIMDALAALGERIGKLEAGSSTTDADGDDEDEDDDTSTMDADGDEDEDDDKDKGKTKTGDGKGKTRDSSGLAALFQDTVARAEILSPGIKVPTFDAKTDRKKTRDALCGFRRKALDKAYATDEGKAAIDPLLAGRTLDTKKLTCDAATIMFNAASTAMKAANNAGTTGTGKLRVGDTGAVKVATIADMNKGFSDFWKPKV